MQTKWALSFVPNTYSMHELPYLAGWSRQRRTKKDEATQAESKTKMEDIDGDKEDSIASRGLDDRDGSSSSAQEKDVSQQPETQTTQPTPKVPPPPNGGYGWVCTACAATINAHTWGLNSSYGVFLAHYLATNAFPGATPLEYAFVGSLSISIAMLISPLATTTIRFFGNRVCLLIGVILESASFIGASFSTQIWHLFLSQGICFGLGMGFLFIGSVGVVPQWYVRSAVSQGQEQESWCPKRPATAF